MDFFNKRLANQLGFSGLIPFVFLSLACWIFHPDWLPYLIKAQLAYGIAILAFRGGLQWGIALMSPNKPSDEIRQALLWGVLPSLIAWCAMTIDPGLGFLVQIVGFVVLYRVDKRLYQGYNLPDWFADLRFRLTCVVVTALALTFIAANLRQ